MAVSEPSRPDAAPDQSEAEKIAQAQAHVRDVFDGLVHTHDGFLKRYVSRLVHDPARAKVIVQDTWEDALDHFVSYEATNCFRTWLCGIAWHRARPKQRKLDASSVSLDQPVEDKDGNTVSFGELVAAPRRNEPEYIFKRRRRLVELVSSFNDLTPTTRENLLMLLAGLDVAEIAEIRGVTQRAVNLCIERQKEDLQSYYDTFTD